jgi:WD40 repeat protein
VIGSSLNLYDLDFSPSLEERDVRLDNHVCVWSENRHSVAKGHDRAHIAHLERLFQTNPSRVAGSCFDGTVRIFDLESLCVMAQLKGHGHRCWQSVEYSPNALVTCADDGLLRLWDLRASKVQGKVAHEGRVSCLLRDPRSGLLVTASCPDNPHEDNNKGTFRSDPSSLSLS